MSLNKKVFLISPLLLAISSFSMACMKDPENIRNQVKDAITANGLAKTKVMSLYTNCVLRVKDNTPNKLTLKSSKTSNSDNEAEKSMYWYRGMEIKEYQTFDKNRNEKISCVQENSFCGIAPQFTYSQSYLTNKKPGVVIEFKTEKAGWLYNDFTTKNGCKTKAEGGGTYGLGVTGTSASCNSAYKQRGIGNIFNGWLSKNKVQAQVAYVLLQKKKK
ncbi:MULTISPECIES: hypothetical protein [Photorhabdus]|uniref:Uncharacterized protein n=2 Tax=Photorhabdus TaxID=29487 RepID=A0A2S8QIF9_9GAMM|nr:MULTISPECIES: hypothetical protein [Photorhabdus]PQQ30884.1 hypothetical protein C6H64_08640 [Photorhabdus luminescens]EYU14077.1 hypothetical protein BA1DRAFT_03432 [Photorhabdus aegyptia]MBS9429810.1 hypothetical protein [Photorhabdus akhurstii]MBS9433366.1 hypothetical protein [Photorhabdus hainanensis]MCC8460371.1 hypothetical protein [Photorhabdus aegyptia]